MSFKIKVCQMCGREYLPTGANQKWCLECIPEMAKKNRSIEKKRWKKANPEKVRTSDEKRRKEHPEKHRLASTKWRLAHPGYHSHYEKKVGWQNRVCVICGKQYQATNNNQKYCLDCRAEAKTLGGKGWRLDHPMYGNEYRKTNAERKKVTDKAWKLAHPNYAAAYVAAHPEVRKAIKQRNQAKRRLLGFTPLNEPFVGSDAHHIDAEYVIFIPSELHDSVRHNQWTGWGMEQINSLAFAWFAKDRTRYEGGTLMDTKLPEGWTENENHDLLYEGVVTIPVEKRSVDECYSRTVGYLRPVSQWNLGKKAEFKDRVMYEIPKNLEKRIPKEVPE